MRPWPALLAAALACAGPLGGQPDWVDGPSSAYPEAAYVVAAGAGADVESARRAARAELSRVFLSRVESEVRDSTSQTTTSGPEGRRSSLVERLEIDTRVATEGLFRGVRIVETWRAPSGVWHALAAAEKREMRAALAAELDAAEERLRGHRARASEAPTPLGRGRALSGALRAAREADGLVARARVVGGGASRSGPSAAEVAGELEAALDGARFQVLALEVDAGTGRVTGRLPKLREQLEERITGIGFRVSPEGREDANVWLTCRMSLSEIPRDLEGHFFRWQGAWEVSGRPPAGPVVLSFESAGGESYATRSLARTRALTRGAQELAGELEGQISRYLREGSDH